MMACVLRRLSACNQACRVRQMVTKYRVRSITISGVKLQQSAYMNVTVKDIEEETVKTFTDNEVSDAAESSNFIIAHALGHKTLFSVPKHQVLSLNEQKEIDKMTKQRLKHIPIQYILQEWDFKDITLAMKPPVFIPRPETEELIIHMFNDPVVSSSKHFVEIGPGSGAICLSLLNQYPTLHCTAFEAGTEAAELTVANAVSLELSSRLTLHNLALKESSLQTVTEMLEHEEPVDFIVSNPPYILSRDMAALQKEIAMYEDDLALDGGPDGLCVIRHILNLAQKVLSPGGSLWLETDSSHPSKIKEMASSYRLDYCETIKDFGQHDRFCHLVRK